METFLGEMQSSIPISNISPSNTNSNLTPGSLQGKVKVMEWSSLRDKPVSFNNKKKTPIILKKTPAEFVIVQPATIPTSYENSATEQTAQLQNRIQLSEKPVKASIAPKSQITNATSELGRIPSKPIPFRFTANKDTSVNETGLSTLENLSVLPPENIPVLIPPSQFSPSETVSTPIDIRVVPKQKENTLVPNSIPVKRRFGGNTSSLNLPLLSLKEIENTHCLICLEKILRTSRKIDEEVVDNTKVLQAIYEVTLKRYSDDELIPKQVCNECFRTLKSSLTFCRLVTASYTILKSDQRGPENVNSNDTNPIVQTEEIIIHNDNNGTKEPVQPIKPPSLAKVLLERKKLALIKSHLSGLLTFKEINVKRDQIALLPLRKCKFCGTLIKKEKIRLHLQKHRRALSIKTGIFPCSLCARVFRLEKKLRAHEILHNGEQGFRCKYCDKVLKTQSCLQSHEKIHLDFNKVACSDCGKSFRRQKELDIHIKAWHTGERSYMCEICGAGFPSGQNLRNHKKNHEPRQLCQICGKEFAPSTIGNHLRTHKMTKHDYKLSKKRYKCEICNKEMLAASKYKHLRTQHSLKLRPMGVFGKKVFVNPRTITENQT